MNTLSRQAPLPSMLIATPCFSSTPVKSTLVNWLAALVAVEDVVSGGAILPTCDL